MFRFKAKINFYLLIQFSQIGLVLSKNASLERFSKFKKVKDNAFFEIWKLTNLKSLSFVVCCLIVMFKSNERSEYSCIGLGDFFVFFSRKSLTFCLRSILIFRGLTGNFFLSSVHFHC